MPEIVSISEAMKEAVRLIERVAPSDASVLITGESGTGKELVAHAIHRLSNRADSSFIDINCAAFQESLLNLNSLDTRQEHSQERKLVNWDSLNWRTAERFFWTR